MRKFIISFAVMAISASVILSVNENRKLDSLIAVNAEALASGEVTLMGKCEDEMNDCIAICESCNRQFYARTILAAHMMLQCNVQNAQINIKSLCFKSK